MDDLFFNIDSFINVFTFLVLFDYITLWANNSGDRITKLKRESIKETRPRLITLIRKNYEKHGLKSPL